jgi:hypothetical protein
VVQWSVFHNRNMVLRQWRPYPKGALKNWLCYQPVR